MDRGGKMMASLLAIPALIVGAQAVSFGAISDDPYQAIIDRNVFDLRPMPAPAVNTAPPAPPLNVKLVGLLRLTGEPQAVVSILDSSAPNKQPATFILSEGQRHASVEVKSINMDTETARVEIGGDVLQLKLEKMLAPAAGPGPAGAPAVAAAGRGPLVPGARPGGRGAFPVPAPGNPAAPASYQPAASQDGLPSRPVRTDSTEAAQAMTPEQSLVQMEQMRNVYQQNNDPRAQLLPPNPLQAALQAQQQQAAAGSGTSDLPSTPAQQQLSRPIGMRTTGTMIPPPPVPGR